MSPQLHDKGCIGINNLHFLAKMDIQSKSGEFKCLGTSKPLELTWSWSNLMCWECLNLPLFNYTIELTWSWSNLTCWKCLNFPLFNYTIELTWSWSNLTCWKCLNLPLFNYTIELIWSGGTVRPDKFKFSPFHPQTWAYAQAHTTTPHP